MMRVAVAVLAAALTAVAVNAIGEELVRVGDEIVVCGRWFHTGTRVVNWMEPGGYDAYRTEARFVEPFQSADYADLIGPNYYPFNASYVANGPARYSSVRGNLTDATVERVRGGSDWDLPTLQAQITKFVVHYDQTGFSQETFRVLHDERDLSIHLMIDLDGTVYQTLDLKDQARHATIANPNSIGVEIANIGAYTPDDSDGNLLFSEWYGVDANNQTQLTLEPDVQASLFNSNYRGRPMRNNVVAGTIQGQYVHMFDFTPEQYAALIKLTATLAVVFPQIALDVPRDANGAVITTALSRPAFDGFRGVMGHFHVQTNKIDPGPAFQFDYVLSEAAKLLPPSDDGGHGHPNAGGIAAGVILSALAVGICAFFYWRYRKNNSSQPQARAASNTGAYAQFTSA